MSSNDTKKIGLGQQSQIAPIANKKTGYAQVSSGYKKLNLAKPSSSISSIQTNQPNIISYATKASSSTPAIALNSTTTPKISRALSKLEIYTPRTLTEPIDQDSILSVNEIEIQLEKVARFFQEEKEEHASALLYSLAFHIEQRKYSFCTMQQVQICLPLLQTISTVLEIEKIEKKESQIRQLIKIRVNAAQFLLSAMISQLKKIKTLPSFKYLFCSLLGKFDFLETLIPYIQDQLIKEERFITPDSIVWITHLISQETNIKEFALVSIMQILKTCMQNRLYPKNTPQSFNIINISVTINKLLSIEQLDIVQATIIQLLLQKCEKIGQLKADKQASTNWEKTFLMPLLGNIVCFPDNEEMPKLTTNLLGTLLQLPINTLTVDSLPDGRSSPPQIA